jgi:putative membrane protein
MIFFSDSDQTRIAEAITSIERKTSAEIVAVVAADSGSYLHIPFLWAALAALIVPWPLIYFTWWPVQWIYLVQLAVFAALVLALFPRSVRIRLVPRGIAHDRAHRRAVEQFLVQNLTTTKGRTGVLIFVSVAERYAEIIPDIGIAEKVEASVWQAIVDKLTGDIGEGRPAEGFVAAIESVGGHLVEHFPPGSHDPRQLPNHLIVLD